VTAAENQEFTTEARSHGEKQKKVGLSPASGYGLWQAKKRLDYHAAFTEAAESTEKTDHGFANSP
jgi:hypothetical protein